MELILDRIFRWLSIMPLGMPVVPEEKIMAAVSFLRFVRNFTGRNLAAIYALILSAGFMPETKSSINTVPGKFVSRFIFFKNSFEKITHLILHCSTDAVIVCAD